MLGQRDRRRQGPTPGPEVFRRELLTEMLGEVGVQDRRGHVGRLSVALEPEQARAAVEGSQRPDRVRELVVNHCRPHELTLLRAKAE